MRHLFPICLNLQDRACLVVGGGQVAERKIASLLEHGAQVRVISNAVTARIKQWQREKRVEIYIRGFIEEDLEGVFLVFIATNNCEINREISHLCHRKGILINVADDPEACDFLVPSVLRRGSLQVAVSTEGKSPAYARKLRQELEAIITPSHGEFVDLLGEVRDFLHGQVPDSSVRKQIIESIVYSDILNLIQVGEKDKAKEKIRQCMSFWQD
jgi:precorrin-2 dehydrogenase/sirohydrochlorin ferrochelatase